MGNLRAVNASAFGILGVKLDLVGPLENILHAILGTKPEVTFSQHRNTITTHILKPDGTYKGYYVSEYHANKIKQTRNALPLAY